MFLNFIMTEELQSYCSMDLSHWFGEKGQASWDYWTRLMMGFKPSPYGSVEPILFADEVIRGTDMMRKTPSSGRGYVRSDSTSTSDFVTYNDDVPTGGTVIGYLGVQDTPLKWHPDSKRAGAWSETKFAIGSFGVGLLLIEERWDKTKVYMLWISIELNKAKITGQGLPKKEMDSKHSYLVYTARTYPQLTPYLKGIHHTLEAWWPTWDEDG
eukprot:8085031-Ditylum_brightwellii.AAC.1